MEFISLQSFVIQYPYVMIHLQSWQHPNVINITLVFWSFSRVIFSRPRREYRTGSNNATFLHFEPPCHTLVFDDQNQVCRVRHSFAKSFSRRNQRSTNYLLIHIILKSDRLISSRNLFVGNKFSSFQLASGSDGYGLPSSCNWVKKPGFPNFMLGI